MMSSVWDKVIDNAEKNYVPGAFTTFIAYEWTSGPNGNNLHRNVIFRDGADPEDLWAYMAEYEKKTGGQVLAIPHNGNLSNGLMFQLETLTEGKPFDADYAKHRQQWEPVIEVTQPKGNGEAHPLLSPDDANLDRIQMIKGWVDADGKTHEKIYDITLSDGRVVGADGRVPPVGDTVDLSGDTPLYTNEIGDAVMAAYWSDPEFDASQRAFYYVRVIEIPTPRWTAYDSKYFGVKIPEGVTDRVQDRAYTSPVWYTPKG